MALRAEKRYADRVPVNFCAAPRFFTPIFGMEYNEIFWDALTQYRFLLDMMKFDIENFDDDICTEPVISIHPYFDNVTASAAFGCEIAWPYNETPQAVPILKAPEDVQTFAIPEPTAALWGRMIDWWEKMHEYALQTQITFNGKPGRVEVAPLTLNTLSPHMIAVDLVGDDFYWWMAECPQVCHTLLEKITTGMIRAEEYARKIDPRPRNGYALADDSAQIISSNMFDEFIIPYDDRLFTLFGDDGPYGRGIHMCGHSTHLHDSLLNKLRMSSFILFGYPTQPEEIRSNLGSNCLLWGNVNPVNMLTKSAQLVKDEAGHVLEVLAPLGVLMLGDGANLCPGTPLENIRALAEAAEKYAQTHPQYFPDTGAVE